MMQPLPEGKFSFLSQKEIDQFDLMSLDVEDQYGYMIECNLSYPTHLHNSHSRLPLACERIIVTEDMLSGSQVHTYLQVLA